MQRCKVSIKNPPERRVCSTMSMTEERAKDVCLVWLTPYMHVPPHMRTHTTSHMVKLISS